MMNVFAAGLLITGAVACLLGVVGVLRLPDVLSRLQAAGKLQTFGLLLILLGAALLAPAEAAGGLLLVALFQVITAPVLAQLAGRAAYRTGHVARSTLVTDDLAERHPDQGRAE